MARLLRSTKRFLCATDGPTAVEYAVMLAMGLLIGLVAIRGFGTAANTSLSNSAETIKSNTQH